MPALRSAEDMFTTELQEIYSAERQLTRALPRLAKKVRSERLREMLDQRCEQGEELIDQLDEALDELEVSKGRQKNIAAEGLIEDLQQHLEDVEDERLIDPLLLASVQKIEHYCIAAWGAARSMGALLGQDHVVQTMERVLGEGKRYDDELTELADKEINPRLMSGADEDPEETEDEETEEYAEEMEKYEAMKEEEAGNGTSSRGKTPSSRRRKH